MLLTYAIIFVGDMNRSVLFYRDVLGLKLRFQTPGWSEFETGATIVALHLSEEGRYTATAGDHAAGMCRPGLSTRDLDEFHTLMVSHGVTCTQEPKEVFGARIAQYLDPDGLTISVSQNRDRERGGQQ